MPFQCARSISKPFVFTALPPKMIGWHMPPCRGALQTCPPQNFKNFTESANEEISSGAPIAKSKSHKGI